MLHNILPSSVLAGNTTPYESLHGSKPDISKIRVWGCLVWYVPEDRDRDSKIAPRAVPAVHLGRDHQRKGYLIYVPSLNRVTTGYHLAFQVDWRELEKFTGVLERASFNVVAEQRLRKDASARVSRRGRSFCHAWRVSGDPSHLRISVGRSVGVGVFGMCERV
ncbi:hypothetical protein AB1Y20_022651 [Prymnesium parvum]|uniref:Retroviral polymerase SH3-like domain-containing protein n=1 Tax=Prymnesium parvum TaxID=97485 RepID=A0AB34JIJ6_PRYPA